MKLGKIFLNSLLEARVHAITDTFFDEYNRSNNRSAETKGDLATIKKYIKEKEITNRVKGSTKVDPGLWDKEPLPEDIGDLQIITAEKFVEAVFSRLNINELISVEYSKSRDLNIDYKSPSAGSTIYKDDNNSIYKILDHVYLKSKNDKVIGYIGIETNFPKKGGASSMNIIGKETFIQYSPDKDTRYILWTPKKGAEGSQVYSPSQYWKGVKSTTKERKLGSPSDITNVKTYAKQDLLNKIKKDPSAYINKKTGKAPEPGKIPRGGFPGGVRKYVPTEVDPRLKKGSDTKSFRKKKINLKDKTENIEYFWYDVVEIAGLTEPLKTKEENNEKFIKDRARKLMEEIIDVGVDEDVIEEKDMNKVEVDILPDDKDSDYRDVTVQYGRYVTSKFSVDKKDYTVDPDSVSITMNGVEVLTSEY